ncbi:MAG: hypothetical protein AAFR36_03650 [Bacteroidota bacterium]
MKYVIGIIVFVILLVVVRIVGKAQLKKKIQQREARRKELINAENAMTKEIHENSDWLKENFQLKYIGKRLVIYGDKDGTLLLAKYKEQKLRIGIPWEFNSKEKYHDTEVNLSDWEDETQYGTVGAENFYFYFTYLDWDAPKTLINEVFDELARLDIERDKKNGAQLKKFKTITAYEEAILEQGEIYM